jgi:L-alanine-DL-glutamate epimerase-like enolase superfamily enzyme
MKITSINACVLTVPTSKQMALEFPQHKLVVAEIATDEGVRGLGYSLVFGGAGAESVLVYLETRLKPLLLGEDPLAVERLWEKMYRGDRGVRRVRQRRMGQVHRERPARRSRALRGHGMPLLQDEDP